MLKNRKGSKKNVSKKADRLFYNIDANGNFFEVKEGTRTLADLNRKNNNKNNNKNNKKSYNKRAR